MERYEISNKLKYYKKSIWF